MLVLALLCTHAHTFMETELKHATCGCAHVTHVPMYLLAFVVAVVVDCSCFSSFVLFWVRRPVHHLSAACTSCKLRQEHVEAEGEEGKETHARLSSLTDSLKGFTHKPL